MTAVGHDPEIGGHDHRNTQMYSGPALIEAYEIGERAQWLGVVTTEAIWRQACAANFQSGQEEIIVRASIPTKDGAEPGFAMNWVACYRHDFKVKPPVSVALFYSQFEDAFGPYNELPMSQRKKYANTTDFINERLQQT